MLLTEKPKVAVIGAGPAGLVSARELVRANMEVVVFEQLSEVGGVWVYQGDINQTIEKHTEKAQSTDQPSHGAMYDALHTNLPRDVMAFFDYTFDSNGGGDSNWPRYPHHTTVLEYLQNFTRHFDLNRHLRLGEQVTRINKQQRWMIETSSGRQETFDAVMVCNGHYAKPRVPPLPGINNFRGTILHSHSYRNPAQFAGRRVALFGTSASGADISLEVATTAASTYWCGNAFQQATMLSHGPHGPHGPHKRTGLPSPDGFDREGRLLIPGHPPLEIDLFMFCTGYHYHFPFLARDVIAVDDNWVHPLFHDIMPPDDASIGFIGLPSLVVPFPLFEMQAKWFVGQLQGRFKLPSVSGRHRMVQQVIREQQQRGLLQRHYHRLGEAQAHYYDMLALEAGEAPLPDWFHQTMAAVWVARQQHPDEYRQVSIPALGPTIVPDAPGEAIRGQKPEQAQEQAQEQLP